MPIVSTAISSSATLKASSTEIVGRDMRKMASAVAMATTQFILTNAVVVSTNVVVGPGAGTSTGTLQGMVPSALSALMVQIGAGFIMVGRDVKKFFDAISFGIVQGMKPAIAQGAVIGGGPGTGTGNIVGLTPAVLTPLIMAQFGSKLIVGTNSLQMASIISTAVCTYFSTTVKVQNTDIGVFTPPPIGPVTIPAAPGIGKLV